MGTFVRARHRLSLEHSDKYVWSLWVIVCLFGARLRHEKNRGQVATRLCFIHPLRSAIALSRRQIDMVYAEDISQL